MTPTDPPVQVKPQGFHILLALADKDLHGYGIRSEVLERTEGTVNLWPGVLYRSLKGLVDHELIQECKTPEHAPADARERRYYRITGTGQEVLRAEATRMAGYVEALRAKSVLPSEG